MPSTRELRRRIRSVKNTAQITKAMQMVSATKMRRAQIQALAGRPYLDALQNSLATLISKTSKVSHPLLLENGSKEKVILVLSSDRSLCGALNTNIFKKIQSYSQEQSNLKFMTIGSKGRNFVVKTEKALEADFANLETVKFSESAQIARILIKQFLNKEIGEVHIIYPHFVSTLSQETRIVKVLPISGLPTDATSKQRLIQTDILLEPNPASLLEYVLVHFVEMAVYQTMLETKASEHSARMISMQNATDNAKDLASDLNLQYNQTRQAAITNELLEITSALAALE